MKVQQRLGAVPGRTAQGTEPGREHWRVSGRRSAPGIGAWLFAIVVVAFVALAFHLLHD
jgi:hypothetical protein